ncbi:MAG: hypothetical protein H6510_14755 [Acidobacteria bacterium]|nr:hypothetical protein [Acidobacteriota bacterium]
MKKEVMRYREIFGFIAFTRPFRPVKCIEFAWPKRFFFYGTFPTAYRWRNPHAISAKNQPILRNSHLKTDNFNPGLVQSY